ncbi:hypothetical protein CB0940_05208 [Cercospora beticola]|uniref:Uncharacterized protein n=1 Tax=Cercospora beticola TaxID=122368 RepID=A0A2G5HLI0_CERBT|nr:hypothetical protein CB0940_05208 [Cercospora beticola]PIA93083.1 hypothetical protein CB0940_05208 [Cercospora beticola]WPB02524.1 hypothetical protein RHO25_007160 [Cercospora beticola]CAK1362581.1 unnamed protein product [Cercospora beticola]
MGSEPEHHLVFLRISEKDVRAYLGKIENTADNGLKASIQNPQIIASVDNFPISSMATSVPMYDYTQQLILFVAYGKLRDEFDLNDHQRNIDLWRIGPHFSLVSVEHVNAITSPSDQQPGMVVRGELVSVSVEGNSERNEVSTAIPLMAQSAAGSDWTAVKYSTNTKETFGQCTKLVQSTDPEIKYVYHLKLDRREDSVRPNYVFVEQMRASEFDKLSISKSSLWTSYAVELGSGMNEAPTYAFARSRYTDTSPPKRRLYLFKQMTGWIEVNYINLRPDGSVASPSTIVKAIQEEPIYDFGRPNWYTCQNLQAIDLADGRIMLTWAETGNEEDEAPFIGIPRAIVTTIDKDGALERPWKEVEMTWETSPADDESAPNAHEEWNDYWSSVLVSKDFAF